MFKYPIECPACGTINEASNFIFAKKTITCGNPACNHVMDLKKAKYATKVCPHCGQSVLYDQSKKDKAKCLSCGNPINTLEVNRKIVPITCKNCSVDFEVSTDAKVATCPLCNTENDVRKSIATKSLEDNKDAVVIKYAGNSDTIAWKYPNERITFGSKLIVDESQEVLFFKDGKALDTFGPGSHILETANIPKISSLLSQSEDGFFTAKVIFFNKVPKYQLMWATVPKVEFIEKTSGVPLTCVVRGNMSLSIADVRCIYEKLMGTSQGLTWENADQDGFADSMMQCIRPEIKSLAATKISEIFNINEIDIVNTTMHLGEYAKLLKEAMADVVAEYGFAIQTLVIEQIVWPEDDPNYKAIVALRSQKLKMMEMSAAADLSIHGDSEISRRQQLEYLNKAKEEEAKKSLLLSAEDNEDIIFKRQQERELLKAQMDSQKAMMLGGASAQVEAEKIKQAGIAEAQVLSAKGISGQAVLDANVKMAYADALGNIGANGSGAASSGIMSEALGAGLGLASAGIMMPQMSNIMQSLNTGVTNAMSEGSADAWICSCGNQATGNFCNNCGNKKIMVPTTWRCSCGQEATGKFCNNCGSKMPE